MGVDVDPAMIAFAQTREGRAEYRLGDAHQLDFPDDSFDVVAGHFTLMWLADPARAHARVRATCGRPGSIPQLSAAVLAGAAGTLVGHGASRARVASVLADEFRVLALEAAGYTVQIADFTGPENTAKNLLIRAEKRGRGLGPKRRAAAAEAFAGLARRWSVRPACSAALEAVVGSAGPQATERTPENPGIPSPAGRVPGEP